MKSFWRAGVDTTFPSEDGLDIPPAALRLGLNTSLVESLRPVALGLGAISVVFVISHLVLLPPAIKYVMASVAGGSALAMFVLYAFLRRHRLPPQWAHAVVFGLSLLMLLNPAAHMYFTHDPAQTTYFILIVLGCGSVFLSTLWFAGLILVTVVVWGIVFATLPVAGNWLGYGYPLFSSLAIAAVIYVTRIRAATRLERFRIRDARYKIELEAVLKATDEAQRSLATSMAVGQSIASILELDDLLGSVADLIRLRFACSFVGIFLLDESAQYVVCRAGTGEIGRVLMQEEFRLKVGEEGVVGWVAAHRRPARVEDVLLDSRYRRSDETLNIRSELALPLEMRHTLLGVLDLESERAAAFKEDDVAFMQLLADQVATAIKNASLYQVEKNRRRLAENLYEIGRILSGTLELSKVLALILEKLVEIVPYDRAAVMLLNANESVLDVVASRGFPEGFEHLQVPVREGDVFSEVYRTKQPLSIPDVLGRADWQQVQDLPLARAWLAIPLIHADAVLGMLSLTRETLNAYREDDVTLAGAFAGQAAIALQNARLYAQITQFNQELESLVQQRTKDLQNAFDQVERLDRAKADFIGIASHELRTPLTLLKGYAQMLLEDAGIRQNERYYTMINGIQTGAMRLHEIVESMLDVAKIDNRELRLHMTPTSVPVVIGYLRDSLKKVFNERKQKFVENLRDLPMIQADMESLRKVFYNLLINAIKYTPDGGTITVSGRALQPGELGMMEGGIEIVVSDTGIGIDPGMWELIFVKFYQTGELSLHSTGKTKFKGGGPGLGLAIAKGIVAAHNGVIWVESPGYDEQKCPGSHFHVVLPLRQQGAVK